MSPRNMHYDKSFSDSIFVHQVLACYVVTGLCFLLFNTFLIVCRGTHGEIVYSRKRWIDLDEFLDSKPILEDVLVNRLFGRPDDCQPYMSNDASYHLIKSRALPSIFL
jgi:hypothetical protein